ncbi:GspH/FimT family protein [Chromatocurvus halotolerans]|uniref:GspH/FimT family protein n=1 Tax=Chromatocurvus halotolerans TaxID=1132028 RepID=UPI0030B827B0
MPSASIVREAATILTQRGSEAVKRGAPVTVCPSENDTECGGVWTDGWITIIDDTSGVLRVWRAPAAGAAVNQTGTANSAIRFGALGQRVSADTRLDIEVAGCRGNRARRLDVGPAGRISVQRVACTVET